MLQRIPKFLDRPTVLGIGEIGLNRVTRNEIDTYTEQVELAIAHRQLILIHTPHLEDKLKGTRISVDVLRGARGLEPHRVLVDHAEEHTIEMILDNGFWAGLTLYPQTKISPQRAVDIIEKVRTGPHLRRRARATGARAIRSPCPRLAMEMRRRHHPESLIERVVFDNPVPLPEPVAEIQGDGRRARRRRTDRLDRILSPCEPTRAGSFTSPTARTSTPPTAGTPSAPTCGALRRR